MADRQALPGSRLLSERLRDNAFINWFAQAPSWGKMRLLPSLLTG